jgi:hypothetical protein
MPGVHQSSHSGDVEQAIATRNERYDLAVCHRRFGARCARKALHGAPELKKRDTAGYTARRARKDREAVRWIMFKVVIDDGRKGERRGDL